MYIAAFGLDEGESIDALSKQGPAPAGAAAVRPPDENGFLWIDQDGFAKAFAADADPVEARVMAAVQKPLSMNSFTAKSGPPAWKHLPSWYMVATEDQMIPLQAEEFMAKRMGATVRKLAASHAAMVLTLERLRNSSRWRHSQSVDEQLNKALQLRRTR